MSSLLPTSLYQDRGLRGIISSDGVIIRKYCFQEFQTLFVGSFPAGVLQVRGGLSYPLRRSPLLPCIKCNKKDGSFEHVSVELPPYDSYMDSTSGQLEPASGARASIPGKEYWPEGTASQVRAAGAPEPTGKSEGAPSFGKKPGSRRKKHKTSVAAPESSEVSVGSSDPVSFEDSDDEMEKGPDTLDDSLEEPKVLSSEYVVYQKEPEEEETREYELNKKLGLPHPFIDPEKKKPIEEPLTSQELWWNWRKPDKEQWSRWQRRRPDVETVFLKAMAKTGQIELYGEHPTLTETSLFRARRHLFKEERNKHPTSIVRWYSNKHLSRLQHRRRVSSEFCQTISDEGLSDPLCVVFMNEGHMQAASLEACTRVQAEQERLQRTGPIAYYSEWVKAWKRDTSREAVQKHFEETGEDENTQLIEMFQHQTDREYRIMMGTDVRIPRDPLAMRMPEDQIKQIWGGDPVYPTVNYTQDPDEVIDYRGPDFHEPTPNLLAYLKEEGKIVSREEFEKVLAKEKTEEFEVPDMDEAMARAVDIGENDEGEDSEVEADEEVEEKITRNWSVLKTTPELRKSKDKKKDDPVSLEEAIDDSENLTDFLLDFDDDE